MNVRISAKIAAGAAYLWLSIPSILWALFHWRIFPIIAQGIESLAPGTRMPSALEMVRDFGSFVYGLSILFVALAAFSAQFPFLRRPGVIGFISSMLSLLILAYAAGLSTGFVMCSLKL